MPKKTEDIKLKKLCRDCRYYKNVKIIDGFVHKCANYNNIIGLTKENEIFSKEACSNFGCELSIGEKYPEEKNSAEGFVFYDKGYYSDGWRYLEACPSDISINSNDIFFPGYYRKNEPGVNLFVNGTTAYNEADCTSSAIGTGKANTEKLVKAMGDSPYAHSIGDEKTFYYAAKLCNDLSYGGHNDWFLPSIDELRLMYTNLSEKGLGNFSDYSSYWSSSETESNPGSMQIYNFGSDVSLNSTRRHKHMVRPIRAF